MLSTQGYGNGGLIATYGYGSFSLVERVATAVRRFFISIREPFFASRRDIHFRSKREPKFAVKHTKRGH